MRMCDSLRWLRAFTYVAVLASMTVLSSPSWSATIAYWKFEPGNLTVDSSGNGNSLSNTGVTSSLDISTEADGSGSASFSGTQSVFNTSSSLDLSGETQLTIEWFAKSPNTVYTHIFEHSVNQNSNPGALSGYLYPSFGPPGSVGATNYVGGANYYRDGTPAVSGGLDTWHHYAVRIDNTISNAGADDRIQIFVDGVFVSTDNDFNSPTSTTQAFLDDVLYIGSRNNTDFKYEGLLDEFRISSGLLSSNEFLNFQPPVPEPSSSLLLGFGVLGLIRQTRRRRRRA